MSRDVELEIVEILRREIDGARFTSQRNLARHLGVDSGTMSRILSGRRQLTIEMAVAVISTLDLEAESARRLLELILTNLLNKVLSKQRSALHAMAARPLQESLGIGATLSLDETFFRSVEQALSWQKAERLVDDHDETGSPGSDHDA